MIPRYAVLRKRVGQTPLEAIQEWKAAHPAFASLPVSYAGRLDPMAQGALLILIGDECKKQKDYLGLDKEYEVEVLIDVGSDTGDVLGLAARGRQETKPNDPFIRALLKAEEGTHARQYPVYSSKTVNGTPLFLHALQGTLGAITIPEHDETLYRVQLISMHSLSKGELEQRVEAMLALAPKSDEPSKALGADFRIDAVRESWNAVFADADRSYAILRIRVTAGSGSYMRSLAGRIGKALGTNALALSIDRTRIGKYLRIGPYGVWTKQYAPSHD